jgi:hypothetical protein
MRRADDAWISQDRGIIVGCKIWARLKQQDATSRIGAQSRRKNCAGGAAAYNNDIEGQVETSYKVVGSCNCVPDRHAFALFCYIKDVGT